MNFSRRQQYLLSIILIVIAGFSVYANSFDVPFYLDDDRNITENSSIRLIEITWDGLKEAAFKSPIKSRPVANVSLAFNYYFHGYEIWGYHFVNIAIHILTAVFLYFLLRVMFNSPALKGRLDDKQQFFICLASALIWLVHPLNTQSVTYVIQRMNSLAAMFYVVSLFLYAKARMGEERNSLLLFIGCGLAGLLAIGSKENAATLPFFIALYEWFFVQDLRKKWLYKALPVLIVLGGIGFYSYLGTPSLDRFAASFAHRDFTLSERLFTELRVVLFYLNLFVMPLASRLSLEHDFIISHSFLDPITTLFSAITIIIMMISAVFLAKRQRLIAFAILWYFGNLLIESSFISLEIIFEHRTYIPTMLLVPALLAYLINKKAVNNIPIMAVTAVVVIVLSFFTYSRNEIWRSPLKFWKNCVSVAPNNARAHNNYGVVLRENRLFDESIDEINKAISLKPDFVNAHVNLGNTYQKKGELQTAIAYFQKALVMKPDYAGVYSNLASIYVELGQFDQAEKYFRKNLEMNPESVLATVNLASILAGNNKIKEAIILFEKARDLSPKNQDIRFNLGLAYRATGQRGKAINEFKEVLQINKNDQWARKYLNSLQVQPVN